MAQLKILLWKYRDLYYLYSDAYHKVQFKIVQHFVKYNDMYYILLKSVRIWGKSLSLFT